MGDGRSLWQVSKWSDNTEKGTSKSTLNYQIQSKDESRNKRPINRRFNE
jgi:hypothetical protein